jgi:hypothetical protein
MRFIPRLIPGVLAGFMLLGTASGVLAAKPKVTPKMVVAYGQVSGLATTGFTLTFTPKKAGATAKTWQINITSASQEVAVRGTTGALQNGDFAIVVGSQGTTGIDARVIRFSVKALPARTVAILRLRVRLAQLAAAEARTARGTVVLTGTNPTTLSVSVTTKAGARTVAFAITGTTKFRVGKALVTTPPTFTDGEKVVVRYRVDPTTKALNAIAISVAA